MRGLGTRRKSFRTLLPVLAILLLSGGLLAASWISRNISVSAEPLANDIEIEADAQLTYYLKVTHDGIDATGKVSSDTVTANISRILSLVSHLL